MIVEPLHLNLDVVDSSKSCQVCSRAQAATAPPASARRDCRRVRREVRRARTANFSPRPDYTPLLAVGRSAVFLIRALILGALFAHMCCGTQSVNKIIRLINVEGQRVAFKIRTTARNMFSTTPNCGLLLPGQVMPPARGLVLSLVRGEEATHLTHTCMRKSVLGAGTDGAHSCAPLHM